MRDRSGSRSQSGEVLGDLLIRERVFRYAISVLVLVFGGIGMVSVFASDGPRGTTATVVAVLLCLTVVPVAIGMSRVHLGPVWWSGRSHWRHGPTLFIVYSDLGVTFSVLTYSDAEYALFGTLLFAVVSAYASHFVSPLATGIHVVFTSAVITAIGVVMLRSGFYDASSTALTEALAEADENLYAQKRLQPLLGQEPHVES